MTEKQKHWATDEAACNRLKDFGAQHGLDRDAILEILKVKTLGAFKGTEAEAVGAVAQWAKANEPPEVEPDPLPVYEPVELTEDEKARYDEACKELASVPVWLRVDGRGVYEVSVQTWLPPKLTRVGLVYARQALEDYQEIFGDLLAAHEARRAAAPALQLVQSGGTNGNTNTFSPQVLEYAGKSSNDSLYWKCKGHPFSQYGVTIWEEDLPDELKEKAKTDLSQDLDLTGWTATYSLQPSKNDPDKLVPNKVISLTRAA